MKHIFRSIILFLLLALSSFTCLAADCNFTGGDIKSDFKKCATATGILTKKDINLSVVTTGSDFRTMTATLVNRVQIITSVIAIGIIVWIGLIMILPVSAEAKESAKSKIFSVLMGFLAMIAATIIVNAVVNLLYEILK